MSDEYNGTLLEREVEKLLRLEQSRLRQCEIYHERIYKRLGHGDISGAVGDLELFRRSNQKLNGIQCRIIGLTIDAVAIRQVTDEAENEQI